MDKFSSRQIDLVKRLINNENVTVKTFAQTYNVSTRTIYREIDNINKLISKYKTSVQNTLNGLSLNGKNEEILELKLAMYGSESLSEAKNRKNFIMAELLQCKDPIKIQYFANKFDVSSSTISHHVKDIKERLEKNHINLISKPGVGIYIEGDEKNIRHTLVDLLYKNYNLEQLIGFIENDSEEISKVKKNRIQELNNRLLNIIDYETIYLIERSLSNIESTMDYKIDDRLYIELSIHLSLAIERLRNNEKISFDNITLEKLKKSQEYKVAKVIAKYIENEIDIKIPEGELGYITVHLQGVRVGGNSLNLSEKYLYSLTDKVIDEASKIFNIKFEEDSILKKDLNMHLLYSIYRLKSGYKIRNPLISEIKRQYGDVFNRCNNVLNVLRGNLNVEISDDEIGYICMHFAAAMERIKDKMVIYNVLLVCASGVGTSRMLAARIKKIKEINIVAVSSVLKIDEIINKNPVDLIISTVPIKRGNKRIIVVNPLFTENDIRKLEDELNIKITIENEERTQSFEKQMENVENVKAYSNEISTIVKNTFFSEIQATTVNDVIEELLEEQIKFGVIQRKISKGIKVILQNREGLGTIILPNKKFVIYHCVSDDIKQSMITVGKLKTPINLVNLIGEKELIYTAFLMVAPVNKKSSLEVIGDLSATIIEQDDFIDRLNESKNGEECRKIIEKTLISKLYFHIIRVFN
ncbi:BglG family transcription antiterminator [Clostridium akagii]|uniref:BglG family transcription antiterminator n=1 Tax=Clostridium akagii TaxID=91623 RepID=UPI0004786A9E|nr:BglG family transcription antiterminator [Clostridium akagii]